MFTNLEYKEYTKSSNHNLKQKMKVYWSNFVAQFCTLFSHVLNIIFPRLLQVDFLGRFFDVYETFKFYHEDNN